MHEHHVKDDLGRWHCFQHAGTNVNFSWLYDHQPSALTHDLRKVVMAIDSHDDVPPITKILDSHYRNR